MFSCDCILDFRHEKRWQFTFVNLLLYSESFQDRIVQVEVAILAILLHEVDLFLREKFLVWDTALNIPFGPTHTLKIEALEGYNATSDPIANG